MSSYNKRETATHVGKHGDHPVGGAIGAAVGAAAGAAVAGAAQGAMLGTVAGLPGMAAGVAIGGVVGALVGKGAAQEINRPAYRHGIDAYGRYEGRKFDEIEPSLSEDWEATQGDLDLPWDKAKPAARDAYDRLHNRFNDNEKL